MRKLYLSTRSRVAVLLSLSLILVFFAQNVVAQSAANYAYSTSTTGSLVLDKDGNAIDMNTGATQLYGPNVDVFTAVVQNIGFEYFFMGTRYSQFSVNPDGQLRFGSSAISTHTQSAAASSPTIFVNNTDGITSATGKVVYKVQNGTSGKVLIIEWNNILLQYNGASSPSSTFQLRLYENSGVIEMVYGAMNNNSTSGLNSSIGFSSSNTANTIGQLTTITGTPTYNTSSTSYTTTSYTASAPVINLNSAADGSRRVFTFTPTVPAAPTSFTFSSVTASGMTLNWQDNSANELGFAIYRSTDNTNFTYMGTVGAGIQTSAQTGLVAGTTYYWRVYAYTEGGLSPFTSNTQATNAGTVSGTKTVGGGGADYATLTAAFNDINTNGLSGNVTLVLQAGYLSSNEPAFPVNTSGAVVGTNTVTIYPAVTGLSITSSNATGTLNFNSGQNIIIDGRVGGTGTTPDLVIENTNAGTSYAVQFVNDANGNTIKYCNIKSRNTSTTSGTIVFAGGVITGNDNNTISDNNISDASSSNPNNGIYSAGTSAAIDNSGNTVSNNNIYNYFAAAAATHGIFISSNSSAWTITGNNLYQTTSRTYTSGATHYGIRVDNTSGNSFIVSNNFIGGSAPAAGGTAYTMGGTVANLFRGIFINVGSSAATSVQGNTVTNISLTSSSTTTTLPGVFSGIHIGAGLVNVGTVEINVIGASTGTGSITLVSTSTGGVLTGIYGTSAAALTIQNNIIGSIRNNNTAANGNVFYGIYVAGSGSHVVSGNTVGSTTQANSITNGIAGTTTATSTLHGIYSTATSSTLTLNSNIVRNLTVSTTGTSTLSGVFSTGSATNLTMNSNTVSDLRINGGGGTMYGLAAGTSVYTVNNNTVSNLSIVNSGSATSSMYGFYDNSSPTSETLTNNQFNTFSISGASTSTSHILYGIYSNTTTGSKTWSGNTINGLSFTNSSTGTASVFGIGSLLSSPNIFRNKIYDLSAQGATSLVTGILISSGNTVRVYNNLIGDLKAPNGNNTTTDVIRGISITSTTGSSTVGVYYNSVYINATGGAAFTTSGIYHVVSTTATTAALDLRNNNIINTSAPGTGLTIAYRRSAGAASNLANYAATSNNNNFFAGTPGANNLIYYDGTGSAQTISAYKAGSFTAGSIAPRDALSVSVNAPFLSTVGSSPGFLHIDPAVGSPIEKGGAPVAGITDDFDGDTRNVNLPDIGADEGNFTLLDNNGPSISYTALTFSCSPGSRTLSGVTITDASGVPTTGGLMPRVYFKKGVAGTWVSTAGTLTSGDGFAGTWSFNIDATLVGGIVAGDVIYYYVIAQDQNGTPNINSSPSGVTATDVNTVTVHPGTPNNYANALTLATNNTVGAGGTYTTLTAAVAAYNSGCLPGAVVFNLTDASYSTNETFPIVINANTQASAVNTLTIKPASGVTATISGNVGSDALLKLNGADYIIIDGSNNGTTSQNLTLVNTNTTSPALISLISLGTSAGATNNVIKNTILTTNAASPLGASFGISIGASLGSAAADNDNVTIQNNTISGVSTGIYAVGVTSTGVLDNLNITGNTITANSTIVAYGIRVGQATGSSISQNTVNATSSAADQPVGISAETGFVSSTITRNLITGVSATNTGGYGARGITVGTGSSTSNVTVANNVIYGVTGTNWTGFGNSSSFGMGIGVVGNGTLTDATGGVNVFYNSINMATPAISTTTTGKLVAAFYVGSGATSLNVRNNAFSITSTNDAGTAKNYAIYSAAASTAYTTIDNNNYYGLSSTNTTYVLGYLTSDRADLAAWKTATGKDVNSKAADPTFNSNTNLVPLTGSPLVAGGAVVSVTTDYLGTTRSATTPTIGAFEVARDAGAPTITYTSLALTCLTSNRTLTATITDFTAVATGGNAPRVYYRKGTGSWFSTAGTLTTGTLTNGTWDFTIDNSLMGGVTAGDVISYYIVAQDVSSPVNVGSSPAGVVASDVNTITTHPATPNTYIIGGSISGAYTVGSGGNYATLTAAVAAYNSNCLGGAVTFNLTDASYSTNETFPIVINANADASAAKTLTIKPATGVTATISGNIGTGGIIKLSGADYIIIDGSNNGSSTRDLTIRNTSNTTAGNTVVWLGSPALGNGANNNTIKNTIIEGDASTTTFSGVFMGSNTAITTTSGGAENNNNNTFNNNLFRKLQYGVLFFGYGAATPDNNNVISNNSFGTVATGEGFSIAGIHVDRQNALVVSGNEVQNVTGSGLTNMYGIRLLDFKNGQAFNNKIHDVFYNGTGTTKNYGLAVQSSTYTTVGNPSNAQIYNNVIYNINSTGTSAVWNATGLLASQGYGDKYYYNSVNMGGQINNSTTGLSAAFGLGDGNITNAGANADIRNNIFVLSGTSAGGNVWAFYTTITSNAGYTFSNNVIRAAGTGATNFTGRFNSTNHATLAAWQTATGLDANSLESDPQFNTATVLMPQVGSPVIGAGTPVSVTTDINGATRSATTPSIGAYETAGDGAPPVINVSAIAYGCSTGNQTLSANITDPTGIPTSGLLVPRVYYKKNVGGAWFSQPGVLASGTATNSNWNFTIVAADMGGLTTSDVIYYYVIAQDIVGTPNVGSSPAGVAATNVNTVLTHPASTLSMTLNGTNLSGNYNIGAGGAYTTLTAAVNAYNTGCITGGVTFTLTDPAYSSPSETFPIVINANGYANSTNTLTIRPAANTAVSITGTSGTSASGLIRLNGADYVTIDGIRDASGTSLTIENTSSTTGTAVIWLSSNGAGQGATNNTIKNVTLKGGIDQKAGSNTSYGVVIAGNTLNGTITSVTAGDDNDNNTIDTCYFIKLRYGVYTRGGSATNPNTGTMIKRNIVGPSAFGVDEIGKAGIVVREEDGVQILNNEVRYVGGDFANNPGGAARAGIALATDATWTPTSVFVKNAKVMSNVIHDIMDEKTGAALGVLLAGADGTNATNNIVANNFIYGIRANGTTAPNQAVGIGISAGNGDKVVFNSVNLTGSVVPSGGATVPTVSNFGIRVSSTSASNLSLLNNIVVMDLSGGGALANYCIDLPTAYSFGTGDMNYNNWYANPANSQSRTGSYNNGAASQSANLAAWQGASSKDANSKEIDPQFISSTDLHLQSSSTLDGQATPVVGVTTDIDNQARSATTPDIGADELPAASGFDVKPLALVSPAVSARGCYNVETITVSIQNNGSSVINFAGTPVTINVAVNGATTFNYPAKVVNSGTLAAGATLNVTISTAGVNELDMSNTPGIYTFDITTSVTGTTDVNTANDVLQETRTKEVLTVGLTAATPGEFCKNGKPTLSTTGANGYSALQWKQSTVSGGPYSNVAGGNVASLTVGTDITTTTFYVLEATCGTTTELSVESTVIINNAQVTVTPGTRCGVGTVNLSATTTGTSINWYAASTGGAPIATGNNFTTPSINTTTTYYAAGVAGTSTISAGLPSTGAYGTYGSPGSSGYGIYFTTNKGMTLQTVAVYPATAGSCTIQLQDGTGTLVPGQEVTVNFTATDVKTLVTLNFIIPSAGSYRLMNTGGTAYLNRYNPYSGPAYPISYDGGSVIFTQGSLGTGTYYSFFDWKLQVQCEGDRVPVTATVTSPPALTSVTATPATICVGQSSNLNVTSGNANYTYSWAPIGQPGAAQTVNPTSTTTYTVTATDAGTSCVTTGTATVTVNPVPSPITISPTTLTLCPNSAPGLLTANGGTLGGVFTLGTGSATPTSSNAITPYTSNWEGSREQYLIRASELTALGMVAGNITGLSFNVTASGSGAVPQSNFTIKMAATANTALNSAYGTPTGSFTTVYTAATEPAPPVGWKQYVFTTPFVWDGSSNVLIDICHDNDPNNTCALCYSGNSTVAASTTSFNSVWGSYDDNTQSCGVQASTLITTFNIRPDIRFDAQTPTTITWASTTGLFTDAAGTTAYAGTSTATVYANPASNTTYTITATTGANCTATQTVSVVRSSAVTNATTLAGTAGGAQVCSGNLDVAVSNNYFNNCNIIATIAPSGGSAVSGDINACVKIDNTVQTAPNGQPFVQRHFDITPVANAATATSTITLYFTQAEFNAYNAARGTYPALPTGGSDAAGIANLRVTQYNGTGTAPGNYTGTASVIDPSDANIVYDAAANSGTGMWRVTFNVTGSGGFYVHTGNYVLPVTITAFNGENAGSVNKLFWTTSSESNSKGFELERSADGVNFTRITFVATKANGGNSTTALSYGYDDRRPLVGANYYRLKQIDNDGKYAYSNVVLLNRKVTEIMITKVYPNPASAELNIQITSPRSEKLTLVVTDLTGKVVMQQSMNVMLGDNQQQLQIGSLAGGTYMIKAVCANGCETAVQRFVKQ